MKMTIWVIRPGVAFSAQPSRKLVHAADADGSTVSFNLNLVDIDRNNKIIINDLVNVCDVCMRSPCTNRCSTLSVNKRELKCKGIYL